MKGGTSGVYNLMRNIMDKCRFSVIISAYNVEPYIERAIDSVLNQNFDNYELIVVEDKSTDKSLEKIMQYKGRVKIIKRRIKWKKRNILFYV